MISTVMKIVLLPTAIAYEFTFALFIMPLCYGKRKLGIFGFVPLWLLYWCLLPVTIIPKVGKYIGYLNNAANWCMGYPSSSTVSSTLGGRIDRGEASWVEIIHCKVLGMYDPSGSHCSKSCKGFLR